MLQRLTGLSLFALVVVACDGSAGDATADMGDAGEIDTVDDATDVMAPDGGDAAPGDTVASDVADSDGDGDETWPPEARGPYAVGHRGLRMVDDRVDPPARVTVGVWYPAANEDGERTRILLIETGSYDGVPVSGDAPFPLVMFSHGSNGANFQSFTYYEYLASHGFVVAAPDHRGNMISDSPSDEEMAEVAARRPDDVMRALAVVEADPELGPAVSGTPRAISGHSFGGYTALVLAGGVVDVDAAAARCEAGTASDVFCPYIPYWDPEATLGPPEGADVFEAAVVLAPGGYAAFGDEGLASVDIPVFVMGGTVDEFTATDIGPIVAALPGWALSLLVERGGHMMFTDICRLPFAESIEDLAELCDPEIHIATDRGFAITNTYATAFLRYVLNGEAAMMAYLTVPPVVAYEEATLEVRGAP